MESLARVLSSKNRLLVDMIIEQKPESLAELEILSGRAKSNLSRTLKNMEHYGFVRLHRGLRGQIRPEVPYRAIALEMTVSSG